MACSTTKPGESKTRSKPKRVAGVITAYRHGLHADVLLGKVLEGWKQDGGPGPNLQLVSMYVDQFPEGDMARPMSKKYNVPIFESIEKAITLGGAEVAVDGVISIGEHGDYPWNDKEQHLYPRRRFFEEITATFEKYSRVVPVFNDKHLGPVWVDAKWMYDRSRELNVPFMAGSSMPVGYRLTDAKVPLGSEIEAAVGVGYSGLDIYGSHTLEFYQNLVDKRPKAEKGVRSVQAIRGDEIWKLVDSGTVRRDLLDAALAIIPKVEGAKLREGKNAVLFRFEYVDGFQGNVFMLPDYAIGTSVALKLKGRDELVATGFDERTEPRHPHFAYLLKAIEKMIHTGKPTYPVERTLLTSGILDRALTSLYDNSRVLKTPELEIAYQPVDYPFAPEPDLMESFE